MTGTGTSTAAPFVTGVAALMMAYYPNMSVAEIKELIIESATQSSYWNGKCVAKGILNAYGALTTHQHIYGNEYEPHDMLQHWHYCYCGQRKLENHTWALISPIQNYNIYPDAVIGPRRCIYCGVLKLENNVINDIEEVLNIYE